MSSMGGPSGEREVEVVGELEMQSEAGDGVA